MRTYESPNYIKVEFAINEMISNSCGLTTTNFTNIGQATPLACISCTGEPDPSTVPIAAAYAPCNESYTAS